ncbi:MAG: hypothetical protein IPF66_18110 [Holophagales bacterium]|nr:hypothetical protein [Holophagales bacterium]
MPVIDARTLFVASAVVFAGLVISVALAWRELKSLSGPDRFAKSYALFLVGLVLFSLQGQISPVFSYWMANVLVVIGAALVLEGTNLIFGRPAGRRITVATGLAATAAFGYYTLVRYDADVRTILSSAFVAGLLGPPAGRAGIGAHAPVPGLSRRSPRSPSEPAPCSSGPGRWPSARGSWAGRCSTRAPGWRFRLSSARSARSSGRPRSWRTRAAG